MNDRVLVLPLGGNETTLALTPRWADLPIPWLVVSLGAMFLVPLLLLLVLSRYERRLIPRRHALGLLLVRTALMSLLWFIIAFQPTLATHHEEMTRGRVRIAVDLSASMDVADPQRSAAEKLRLARLLRLNDKTLSMDWLEEWARQHDRGEQPTWLADNEQSLPPETRNPLRSRRQAEHARLMDTIDRMPRRDVVRRLLGADGVSLLARLSEQHDIEIVGFHDTAFPLTAEQIETRLAATATDSHATDLNLPLTDPSDHGAAPLLGVVLFSDGRHNQGGAPKASTLATLKAPVFAVVVGSRTAPSDWMVVELNAPGKVFKGAQIPVQVRCQATQLPPQELTVELSFAGKPVVPSQRRIIAHDGKDQVYAVSFQVPADQAGTYAIKVLARSTLGKEVTLANNEQSRLVRVVEEKARVLIVDEDARWEHQYLVSALTRDPTMQVDRVLFTQPRLGLASEEELEKRGHARIALPEWKDDKSEEPLQRFDAIILGDVAPENLSMQNRQRLERYVSERGGTLIVVAGKRSMPLEYLKSPTSATDPLMKMLPITDARLANQAAGFVMAPTREGKATPFLNLDPDVPGSTWPELPKHFWGVAGLRKPGASVLLVGSDVKDSKTSDDSAPGLLVTQNYGFGRVVYLGIDSTWRWRFKVGDTYHHRFWNQLLRWAAADKLLPAGNRFVRFGSREPTYQQGQEVELLARFSELLPALTDPKSPQARLLRRTAGMSEELVANIPLTQNASQQRLLSGKARDLPPGSYRIELDIPQFRESLGEAMQGNEKGTDPRVDFLVEGKVNTELLDLSTNWTLLQDLADKSGGQAISEDLADRVLEMLSRRVQRKITHDERRPWQDPPWVWWLLGLGLGLLTTEWVWRKRLDLP